MGVLKGAAYNLKNVVVTLDTGVIGVITSLAIARRLQVTDRTAGAALREQGVINKEMAPDVTVEVFNTGNLGFPDLIPGAKITALTVVPQYASDATTFLQSDFMTVFPLPWYVGDPSTTLGEGDSSKSSFKLLCHIIASNLTASTTALPAPGSTGGV